MKSDTTYFAWVAKVTQDALHEVIENTALYMVALFVMVLQCAVDYIANYVGQYCKLKRK